MISEKSTVDSPKQKSKRLAIIGSGICGVSALFYLQKLVPQLKLSLFEREEQPGGRIKDINYQGLILPLGANFFSKASRTLLEMSQTVGLYPQPYTLQTKTLASWDGGKILYDSSQRFGYIKFLFRYGFSAFNLGRAAKKNLKDFDKIYERLDLKGGSAKPFESPLEILEEMNLVNFLSKSAIAFCTDLKLNPTFVKDILYGTMMYIFNKPLESINSLPFLFTIKTLEQKPFYFKEGAGELIRRLLVPQGQNFELRVNSEVKDIAYNPIEKTYTVTFSNKDQSNEMLKEDFEIVILAAPLTQSKIRLTNIPLKENLMEFGNLKSIRSTIVEGKLKNIFFNRSQSARTVDSLIFAKGSERILPDIKALFAIHEREDGKRIYKIESERPISESTFSNFFEEFNVIAAHSFHFATSPQPTISAESLPAFELHPGFYFPNAMELAISWLEMQALVGKNIALLIAQKEKTI